eukprot:m.236108 g.236108  ORF g.236108 m.236108 type:complete len:89 (+) comp20438_c0_seq1:1-267(+)
MYVCVSVCIYECTLSLIFYLTCSSALPLCCVVPSSSLLSLDPDPQPESGHTLSLCRFAGMTFLSTFVFNFMFLISPSQFFSALSSIKI